LRVRFRRRLKDAEFGLTYTVPMSRGLTESSGMLYAPLVMLNVERPLSITKLKSLSMA
jgi:hypothetical protein